MLPPAEGDGLRRLQIAALDCHGQRMLVANTHLAFRHEQHDERLAQCRTIIGHLAAAAEHWQTDAILLVGDFNATPGSTPIASITESALGLRDLFAGTDLRRDRNTFPDTSPHFVGDATSVRWIDFIFATDRFEVQLLGLALDGKNGDFVSDHVALEARLELLALGPTAKSASFRRQARSSRKSGNRNDGSGVEQWSRGSRSASRNSELAFRRRMRCWHRRVPRDRGPDFRLAMGACDAGAAGNLVCDAQNAALCQERGAPMVMGEGRNFNRAGFPCVSRLAVRSGQTSLDNALCPIPFRCRFRASDCLVHIIRHGSLRRGVARRSHDIQ